MSATTIGKAEWLDRVEQARATWEAIVADVGEADSNRPGAMGDWTFKDVAAHLTAWRRRTVDRLEAAARGEPEPAPFWPASLGSVEDDPINAWIHDRTKDRPAAELLAEADAVYDDFIAAVWSLPLSQATDPRRFDWLEGEALVDVDFGGHLGEHEPDVRRWLANA